jgi:tRNA-Thr(GGU) m(6)t(6)A37 methyltransferase TsaA
MCEKIEFRKIGIIKTPYIDTAPYQPVDEDEGDFRVILEPKYTEALNDLNTFTYMYVIYFIDRLTSSPTKFVSPSWTPGTKVGLFASRTPVRPNPIGLSIVRIKEIVDNEVFTTCLDVFDNTPLLDIKPYVKDLDSKDDANYGWLDYLDGDKEHLFLHIKGIPHGY